MSKLVPSNSVPCILPVDVIVPSMVTLPVISCLKAFVLLLLPILKLPEASFHILWLVA